MAGGLSVRIRWFRALDGRLGSAQSPDCEDQGPPEEPAGDLLEVKPAALGASRIALILLASLTCASADAAGQEWAKLPTTPYVLNNKQDALAFADGIGWYGNGTGQVYRTTDLGDHWKRIWKSRGTYVRALEFIDGKTGFLATWDPATFRT